MKHTYSYMNSGMYVSYLITVIDTLSLFLF